MTNELKEKYINKIAELLEKPITNAKIQIDYKYDEVPTIRYDITERIIYDGEAPREYPNN